MTALNRCTVTDSLWNRYADCRSSWNLLLLFFIRIVHTVHVRTTATTTTTTTTTVLGLLLLLQVYYYYYY